MNSVVDWPQLLAEQLDFHWSRLPRPRLDGLTDQEYFGEPVPDCWSLRPHRDPEGRALNRLVMDRDSAESDPPPFTTISWRLAHVICDVLGARTHRLFDGSDSDKTALAETATDALTQLDDAYRRWQEGVSAMTESRLAESCGAEEPYFEGQPLTTLVLHVNREVLCHCAEIALFRDLYAQVRPPTPDYAQS